MMNTQKYKARSGFIPPNLKERTNALGDLVRECQATVKAVKNIPNYWEPCRVPEYGDWLDAYKHGCIGYD